MKVFNGDNLELLKQYPDNYFDAVVTDPPYGLGKEPDTAEMLKAWVEHGYMEVKGSGFMGKEWDAFVPQPIFWKEVFRVLKHGGHVLSFYGTRTYDWGVMAMRLAGFEVRDCIQWVYGSGFPKSHNIGKAVDKLQNNERVEIVGGKIASILGSNTMDGGKANSEYKYTKGNSEWEGWGSALKPANEPIVLARKPIEKGLSIAENVLKWGTGAINIDGCRVNIDKNDPNHRNTKPSKSADTSMFNIGGVNYGQNAQGRFPANLILTHHPECECIGTKKVGSGKDGGYNYEGNVYEVEGFVTKNSPNANSNYGKEEIENWNCHEDCPIRLLDEQSGESKSSKSTKLYINDTEGRSVKNSASGHRSPNSTYADKGGASRFFYVAKSSKSERNKGLEGFEKKTSGSLNFRNPSSSGRSEDAPSIQSMGGITNPESNFHPTVKPIKLMQYLVRLITPPNGIVLDPFCGSGTTGIACKLDGFDFVGIEQDAEYTKIAQARIDNYVIENTNNKKTDNDDSILEYKQTELF